MTSGDRRSLYPDVAVNLMWCRPGGVGGSEEYLCRQLMGLPSATFDMTVFAPRGFSVAHPELVQRFRIVEMDHPATSRARRIVDESTWLYDRTRSADLIHHGGGTVPVRRHGPIVLTVHDVQYLRFPQYFSRLRLGYLTWAMPRAIRAADVITVPTEFVRRTVIDSFAVDADDVVVVPHGLEPTLGIGSATEQDLRDRHRLGDGPVVVYPAMSHPHKGHGFLLDVHRDHWADQGVTLVLIGGEGGAEKDLRRRLNDPATGAGVRRLGRVSARDRDGLIKMARAVAFPSQYEGFGAPVVEAMALGTPVITSDQTCLPEVVADAGLVLPLDSQAWGSALDTVENLRSNLIERGLRRSAQFTSSISGEALAGVYHRLVG